VLLACGVAVAVPVTTAVALAVPIAVAVAVTVPVAIAVAVVVTVPVAVIVCVTVTGTVTVSSGAAPVLASNVLCSDVSHAASNVIPSNANISINTFPAFPPDRKLSFFIVLPFWHKPRQGAPIPNFDAALLLQKPLPTCSCLAMEWIFRHGSGNPRLARGARR
jgi:hypothetical protein